MLALECRDSPFSELEDTTELNEVSHAEFSRVLTTNILEVPKPESSQSGKGLPGHQSLKLREAQMAPRGSVSGL